MSVIGLLEGQRLRYRLGDPMVRPEDWTSGIQNRDVMTTDWTRLWLDDRESAKARYFMANQSALDYETYPTLESWLQAHGGIPGGNSAVTPDPAVSTANPGLPAANNEAANAQYAEWAAAQAAEAARLATLPRDPVVGPAFLPDPAPMSECTGRSGEVSCTNPAADSRGGRAEEHVIDAASPAASGKSMVLPLLALAAAWMVLK